MKQGKEVVEVPNVGTFATKQKTLAIKARVEEQKKMRERITYTNSVGHKLYIG